MKISKSKKGFYLVSPFVGFMFFLIAVAIGAFFISEDHQAIETAESGVTTQLAFITYAMHADAIDVFLQNHLQQMLDTHVVSSDPLKTQIQNDIQGSLTGLPTPYETAYNSKGISCNTEHVIWSDVYVTFNNAPTPIITYIDTSGNTVPCTGQPVCPTEKTAVKLSIQKYSLGCTMIEPPVESEIPIEGRWYYLDGRCICCQYPSACGSSLSNQPFADCVDSGKCTDAS